MSEYCPCCDDRLWPETVRQILDGFVYPCKCGALIGCRDHTVRGYCGADYDVPGIYWLNEDDMPEEDGEVNPVLTPEQFPQVTQ